MKHTAFPCFFKRFRSFSHGRVFEPLRKKFRTRTTYPPRNDDPNRRIVKPESENFPQFIRKHVGRNR